MPNLNETNVPDFSQFGEVVPKSLTVAKAARTTPQSKFIERCKDDIARLNLEEDFGKMFTKRKEGRGYAIVLLDGDKVLPIPDGHTIRVADAKTGITALEHAIKVCETGYWDDVFTKNASRPLAE